MDSVPTSSLRRRCDPASLGFDSTAAVDPVSGVIGQDQAVDALRFGLATNAPGHHVFVRGLEGTGRMSLVRQMLREAQPSCPLSQDYCYVHDFDRPEQPRLIALARGEGREFGTAVERLVTFIRSELAQVLQSERVQQRLAALQEALHAELESLTAPVDAELRANELALVTVHVADTAQPAIFPVVDGTPVSPEQFEQLRQAGTIDDERAQEILDRIARFSDRLPEVHRQALQAQRRHREKIRSVHAEEVERALHVHTAEIAERFPEPRVAEFLAAITRDLVTRFAAGRPATENFTEFYRVNVLASHAESTGCPALIETRPSVSNLLGTIEREWPHEGERTPDHLLIRAGSLLRANGGYLILDIRDLLLEPGAWPALVRTLRSGRLQITSANGVIFGTHSAVKPEPIDVDLKVLLVGGADLYYSLDEFDPDFPYLFKVLVDFDSSIPRDAAGERSYAGVLAHIASERGLLPFGADAVAALIEHGARIAGRQDRLTSRFGRLADVADEAAFLARNEARDRVDRTHVGAAVRRGRARADLPARHYRDRIADGTIRIQTSGSVIGQVNGLAVAQAGPLVFGFPARITASIGAGTAGTIDIEGVSRLGGAIHTKGFHILEGLLRHLITVDHPLAFRASIAFEQSYGGVDGDSASGAEFCCLLSALTGVPLRQDLAMTGAIDQRGSVQPIGAVTEKIEGFFDICATTGLSGSQGVIVPSANVTDLMLREDVVAACESERFHVYAVESIHQALELFTGRPAGEPATYGGYPDGTLLELAVERAGAFWRMVSRGR